MPTCSGHVSTELCISPQALHLTACSVCFAAAAHAADGLAATLTTETAGSVQTSHQALLAQSSVTSLASNGMALRGEVLTALGWHHLHQSTAAVCLSMSMYCFGAVCRLATPIKPPPPA